MSDIGLNWNAIDLIAIALASCSPGLLAGLLLGAIGWRGHRLAGGAIGALAGFMLTAATLFFCFRSRIAQEDGLDGAALLALRVSLPGMLIGGVAASWHFGERRIVAGLAGAAIGGVAWLGGWSYFF
ncbi:hypothetical protein BH11PSE4_BH11PSE4_31320 [soil metagenome]